MRNKTFRIDTIIDGNKLNNALKKAYGKEYDAWPEGSHWFMVAEEDKRFFTAVETEPLGVDVFTKDTLFYRLRVDEIRDAGMEISEEYMKKLKAIAEAAVAAPKKTVI